MTKTILLISALILSGLSAQAQTGSAGKKIFIVPSERVSSISAASNSLQNALASEQRLEVTADSQDQVTVQECGPGGCQSVLNKVSKTEFTKVNRNLGAIVEQDCRVCAPMEVLQKTPVDLTTHKLQLQQQLGQ